MKTIYCPTLKRTGVQCRGGANWSIETKPTNIPNFRGMITNSRQQKETANYRFVTSVKLKAREMRLFIRIVTRPLDHFGVILLVTLCNSQDSYHAIEGAFMGTFHYAKDSGNFGRNSNGKFRFGFFRPEYSGSPLEVVHLFRLEYSDRNSPFHF